MDENLIVGIFGFITLVLAMIPMNYIKVGPDWGHNPREVLEDPIDGLTQIINSRAYLLKYHVLYRLASFSWGVSYSNVNFI